MVIHNRDPRSGSCFVTLCTKKLLPFLGKIFNGEMFLSDIGKIINDECYKSEEMRPNIILDEFVVMPNHIHGIIVINNPTVETYCNTSLHESTQSQSINKKNNLSNIIRGFKSSSTKLIHIMSFNDFAWQPRFYEHIIKDEKALDNI